MDPPKISFLNGLKVEFYFGLISVDILQKNNFDIVWGMATP